jgi:hypothetical protein
MFDSGVGGVDNVDSAAYGGVSYGVDYTVGYYSLKCDYLPSFLA